MTFSIPFRYCTLCQTLTIPSTKNIKNKQQINIHIEIHVYHTTIPVQVFFFLDILPGSDQIKFSERNLFRKSA